MTPSLSESPEIRLEVLIMRNEEKERSRAKAGLVRSKSVGSLQSSTVSIEALKAVFESKAQNNTKSSFRASSSTSPYKSADFMPVMNGEAEEVERPAQKVKTHIPAEAPVDDAKEERETKKVHRFDQNPKYWPVNLLLLIWSSENISGKKFKHVSVKH